jgi:hypothetical protein
MPDAASPSAGQQRQVCQARRASYSTAGRVSGDSRVTLASGLEIKPQVAHVHPPTNENREMGVADSNAHGI